MNEKKVYSIEDVAKLCSVSKSKAGNIIRALNRMLIKNGTPKEATISGKISIKFFNEHLKID